LPTVDNAIQLRGAEQASTIKQAANKSETVDPVKQRQSDFDLNLYKKVYAFANSTSGMDMAGPNAKFFSDTWIEKCKDQNFEVYKEYYLYAYSSSGMNMIGPTAKAWASSKFNCLQR